MQDANPGLPSRAPFRAALILAAHLCRAYLPRPFRQLALGQPSRLRLLSRRALLPRLRPSPRLGLRRSASARRLAGPHRRNSLRPVAHRHSYLQLRRGRRDRRPHRLAHLATGRKAQRTSFGHDRRPRGTGLSGHLKFPFHEFLRTVFLDGNDARVAAHRRWQLRSARVARFRTAGRPRHREQAFHRLLPPGASCGSASYAPAAHSLVALVRGRRRAPDSARSPKSHLAVDPSLPHV